MKCVGGHFIGNRDSNDPQNPIVQKCFYSTKREARITLKSGQWEPPQPDEPQNNAYQG